MKLKKLKRYFPIIGIGIFIYILIRLDLSNIFNEIINARWDFLLFAILLVPFFFIMQTLKWFSIAKIQKINVPFIKAIKINLMSLFYGIVTPSKIGAIMRAEYLRDYDENLGKGISNFVLDKILDLCSVVFFVVIFSFVFKDIFSINYFYYALVLAILLSSFLFIFTNMTLTKKIFKIFYKKFVPEKSKEKLKISFYRFYEDMPKKRYFILFFLLNLSTWTMIYLINFLVGLAVGIEIPFFYFFAILPIGTLIAEIPITINGLGTREAAIILLFGLFNITATKVISMSIISLILFGIFPAFIGSLLILKRMKNLKHQSLAK